MTDSPVFSTLSLPADLDADDVLGLADQLGACITAVTTKGNKDLPPGVLPIDALPPIIEKPWNRFTAAVAELEAFRDARARARGEQALASLDPNEQALANAGADDRWRAFEQWNKGSAGLAEDGKAPSPAEARWLYAQLFPPSEGLRFITWRPRAQWVAMEQRMKLLEGGRAQGVIAGFGGARHHAQLLAAHERFGKAYGFTKAVVEADGATDGRPQWVAAREALRVFVQKVEGTADPEIAGSEALAAFLLGPYVDLVNDLEKGRRPAPKKAEAGAEGSAEPATP